MSTEGLYRNNFWEDETQPFCSGFNVLVSRMLQGKETWKELHQFLEKRAKIEEDYNKQLNGLVKSVPCGKDEVGTALSALEALKSGTLATATTHKNFSTAIGDVLKKITDYKEADKGTRKTSVTDVSRLRSELEKSIKKCESLQSTWQKKTKDASDFDKDVVKREASPHHTPHELSKMRNKLFKLEEANRKAGEEYYDFVVKTQELQQNFHNRIKYAADDFQRVDEERILKLQEVLNDYANLERVFIPDQEQMIASLQTANDNINSAVDVQEFTNKKKLYPAPRVTYQYVEVKQERASGAIIPTPIQKANTDSQSQLVCTTTLENVHELPASEQLDWFYKEIEKENKTLEALHTMSALVQDDLAVASQKEQVAERLQILYDHGAALGLDLSAAPVALAPEETQPAAEASELVLLCQCRTLYSYDAQTAEELSLVEGETLNVYRKDDDGWWYGENSQGALGVFPGSYCEEI
eukprot:GCRY01003559.1.p1 GENE.GCRY01003559.1~~GCRY01003559.1.p1  ORF type:complete len:470 (+),score=130.08 GCRY01003559.1:253-1662(+)